MTARSWMRGPGRLGRVAALPLLLAAAMALPAHAAGSLLHEYVEPNPGEDLKLSATTLDGDLPAAIETPSGLATAPDPNRPPDPIPDYGSGTTDDSPDSTYEADRDTRRPEVEAYDDPFSPSTVPFKRLRAYDTVDEQYHLRVASRALVPVAVGGTVGPEDEAFYADFTVQLSADQPVRIPTVGPESRVLKMHVEPTDQVSLLRDGADNWFARSKTRHSVRIVMELAIKRATFGSAFANVGWDELTRFVPSGVPSSQTAAAERVFAAIGVSRAVRPRDAVDKMVAYFRSFAPSEDPPRSESDIYLDLALSKKGVCRHRAFAFLVTALHLGLPTRMVVNEAHAWVEVFDGSLWHRIDLGGAALDLEDENDPDKPMHKPPADPFEWPPGAQEQSGQDLADREHSATSQQAPGRSNPDPSSGTAAPGTSSSANDPASPPPSPTDPGAQPTPAPQGDPNVPESSVVFDKTEREARRGKPTHLKGRVTSTAGPCARIRLDVLMVSSGGTRTVRVGSLSTDDDGKFDGAVVMPRDLAAGDYDLVVETQGDARCRSTRSQ